MKIKTNVRAGKGSDNTSTGDVSGKTSGGGTTSGGNRCAGV